MDMDKCNTLKDEFESEELVPIDRYFDGNDDPASIGCNLIEHPGIDRFREILVGLRRRPDVQAVYAQMTEIDPDDDMWPFTDTVVVIGSIDQATLENLVTPLEPDEVCPATADILQSIREKHDGRVWVIWWD